MTWSPSHRTVWLNRAAQCTGRLAVLDPAAEFLLAAMRWCHIPGTLITCRYGAC